MSNFDRNNKFNDELPKNEEKKPKNEDKKGFGKFFGFGNRDSNSKEDIPKKEDEKIKNEEKKSGGGIDFFGNRAKEELTYLTQENIKLNEGLQAKDKNIDSLRKDNDVKNSKIKELSNVIESDRQQFESSKKQFIERITSLTDLNKDLSEKIKILEFENKKISSQQTEHIQNTNELQTQIYEFQAQINKLEKEKYNLENILNTQTGTIKDKDTEIANYIKIARDLNLRAKQLEDEKKLIESNKNQVENDKKRLEEEKKQLENDKSNLNVTVSDQKMRISELERTNSNITQSLTDKEDKIAKERKIDDFIKLYDVKDLKAKIELLELEKKDLEEYKSQVKLAQSLTKEAKDETENVKNELQEKMKEIVSLQSAKVELEKTIDSLNSKINGQSNNIDLLNNTNGQQLNEIKSLKLKANDLQKQLVDKNSEITNTKKEFFNQISSLKITFENQVNDSKNQLTREKMTVNELQTIKEKHLVQISSLNTTVKSLQKQLDDKKSEIINLISTKDKLSNQIFKLETEKKELSKGSESYISEIRNLKEELSAEKDKSLKLTLYKEDQEKEINSLKSQKDNLKQKINKLEDEKVILNGNIIDKDKNIGQLQNTIQEKDIENRQLRQKISSLNDSLISFSTLIELDKLCKNIKNPKIKEKCKFFFGADESVDKILANISKQGNIENLWQYIFDSIDKDVLEENEIENLKKIFAIAFKYLQATDSNFIMLDTKIGLPFKNSTMKKYSKSTMAVGNVNKVLWLGFGYKNNPKPIRLSLVSIG